MLTIILLFAINNYYIIDLKTALYISLYSYIILIIIGIIRFLNINKYIRIEIDLFLSNLNLIGLGKVLIILLEQPDEYGYKVDFNDWSHYINGNVVCIIRVIYYC